MANSVPLIEFRGINKSFGSNRANVDVSFSVTNGSFHAVVGENGAGKSTIMKILYGMHSADSGEILINGKAVEIKTPFVAKKLGIGMVHQHFMQVDTLPVWKNIILGNEGSSFFLNAATSKKKIAAIETRYGLKVPLDATIDSISMGARQQVEILKQLYGEPEVLILDEPTAVLTPQEVTFLLGKLRELQAQGKTILIVTHKLKEVLEFTDVVTVMRGGKIITTAPTNSFTETTLAETIIGRKQKPLPDRRKNWLEGTTLELRNLKIDHIKGGLNDFSLKIHKGEILGLAGIEGNGQDALIETLAGVTAAPKDSIFYEGVALQPHKEYSLREKGFRVIPGDRHGQGLILNFLVWENYFLGHFSEKFDTKSGFIPSDEIRKRVRELIDQYAIRPPETDIKIKNLSGGNQQKVLVAREAENNIRCLIVAHPTRGVDIGAIERIHQSLLQKRDEGCAILLISSELEEILALSDRVAVIREGKKVADIAVKEADEKKLGLCMMGALQEKSYG